MNRVFRSTGLFAILLFTALMLEAKNPDMHTFQATVGTRSQNSSGSTVYSSLSFFYSRYGDQQECALNEADLVSYKNMASGEQEYQLQGESFDSSSGSHIQCWLSGNTLHLKLLPPESAQCSFIVTSLRGVGTSEFSGGCLQEDGKALTYTALEITKGKSISDAMVPLPSGNLRLFGLWKEKK